MASLAKFLITKEPSTFRQDQTMPERVDVMNKESDALEKNDTWS